MQRKDKIEEAIRSAINDFLIREGWGDFGFGSNKHTWTVEFYASECGRGAIGIEINEPPGITKENWKSIMDDYTNAKAKDIYSQFEDYLHKKYPSLKNIIAYRRN